ncbi:MAG: hypothetical protein ABFD63_10305 [Smithella sp.]
MVQMREGRRILCALSLLLAAALSMGTDPATAQQAQLEGAIIAAPRISPQDAYRQVTSGQAVLVCAYEDEAKCNAMMLQGAISLKEFESRLPNLRKDQPIIFYCA